MNENVVIYDWLSFTTKQHTPEQVIAALGLSECPWSDITGAHGYMDRKYFFLPHFPIPPILHFLSSLPI